jgi:vitamin K-dependent gamma-carboxylase-like protein
MGLLSLHHRNIATNCGPDVLLMITCFLMMLSPCGAALSLDARRAARRRGTPAEPLIIPWAQRLIQIQLCLVYFDTAVLKCAGTTWLTGTAIHYVLFNHEVGQFNFEWLASYPMLVGVLTLAALWMEFALPFLLWFRPVRRWIAIAGVLLHLGIVPLVNAPLFGEQMMALYLLFLDRDELDALGQCLNPLRWFRRRAGVELDPGTRRDGPSGLRGWHQLELCFEAAGTARSPGREARITGGSGG